jgi:hypothetical protein
MAEVVSPRHDIEDASGIIRPQKVARFHQPLDTLEMDAPGACAALEELKDGEKDGGKDGGDAGASGNIVKGEG